MSQRFRKAQLIRRFLMTKIYFRADASAQIGYGHFFRSLALADMLSERFECIFCLYEPTETQVRECEGRFAMRRLGDLFEDFLSVLSEGDVVVLDNYYYSGEYRRRIKEKGCALVCIDDFSSSLSYADQTINHGFNAMGPGWALLRRPFRTYVPEGKRDGITLCFGGSDSLALADSLAAMLGECGRKVTVLRGSGRSAEQMAGIFRSSEVCILSASSVCYEALACGCRVVAGWYADNQKEFYKGLTDNGFVYPLGNLAEELPSRDLLLQSIEYAPAGRWPDSSLIQPRYIHLFQSLLCRRDWHIDGFDFINYTHLTLEQKLEVLGCRNDESVRRWMCNTGVIEESSHLAYIEGLKERDDAFYWAVYRDGVFCGGVSLVDLKDSTADEGIFLNPAMTGRGLGTEISRASFKLYFDIIGLNSIYSLVDENNTAALKMDKRLGFSVSEPYDGFVRIELAAGHQLL